MFEQTKALCNSFLRIGIPGFDLAVWQNGRCVLRHMGGFSDPEKKIPINGTETYYIYSCSKPITCAAALQLWEQGLFSLEDPLSKFLPEFSHMMVATPDGLRNARQPILIRHLFEMTAGFSYDIHSPHLEDFRTASNGQCPTREAIRALAAEPLLFEPGAQWNYSLCHDVLAALVEVLSGQLFEDYVQAHIFRPLGMNDSTFLPSKADFSRLARHYQYDAETHTYIDLGTINQYILGSAYASGGAGCVSTVDDYMKFLEALRVGDTILKKETVALMATGRLNEQQAQTFTHGKAHGFGLGVRTPKAGISTDFGWGGAAGAYLAVDLTHHISLYYAQHVLTSPVQSAREQIFDAVLADLQGRTIALPEFDEAYRFTY